MIKNVFKLYQKIFQLLINIIINFIFPAIVTTLICLIPSSEANRKEISIANELCLTKSYHDFSFLC